jgi:hypothetical protein
MTLLLVLLLAVSEPRTYHAVTIAGLKTAQWTHVAVCGRVDFVKSEGDGDTHIKLTDGDAFIVAEIVPYHRVFTIPKVGQFIRIAGVSRLDKQHGWYEVHPVEGLSVVDKCE